jgi:hypothetical protein
MGSRRNSRFRRPQFPGLLPGNWHRSCTYFIGRQKQAGITFLRTPQALRRLAIKSANEFDHSAVSANCVAAYRLRGHRQRRNVGTAVRKNQPSTRVCIKAGRCQIRVSVFPDATQNSIEKSNAVDDLAALKPCDDSISIFVKLDCEDRFGRWRRRGAGPCTLGDFSEIP